MQLPLLRHRLLLPPMVDRDNDWYRIIPHYLFRTDDKNQIENLHAVNQQKLYRPSNLATNFSFFPAEAAFWYISLKMCFLFFHFLIKIIHTAYHTRKLA